MSILFVAFDSLGVRSQATFIQTKDANIFIDPAAALAPKRFGLPPHITEVERLLKVYDRISELLRDSDIIIFTHYHYDHHDPERFIDPDLYRGKVAYIKDPKGWINTSQRVRALRFFKVLEGRASEIRIADGSAAILGKTSIRFSDPLPHGESDRLGYVIGVCVDDGETSILYTSDIEGGPRDSHRKLLSFCKASTAVVDGPPTYLLGYKYSEACFKSSVAFINELIGLDYVELVILDHHLCRDSDYRSRISQIFERAKSLGKDVKTAAEALGLEPLLLEAFRKKLYRENPKNGLDLLRSAYRGLKTLEFQDHDEVV